MNMVRVAVCPVCIGRLEEVHVRLRMRGKQGKRMSIDGNRVIEIRMRDSTIRMRVAVDSKWVGGTGLTPAAWDGRAMVGHAGLLQLDP